MIETARLTLKPLTKTQLAKYIHNDNSLEAEFGLKDTARIISPELKEAHEKTIVPNVNDYMRNYLFATIWTIIERADKKIVGDFCMKGEPDENGEVEIGFGIYDQFRGNGYMTEAVSGLLSWLRNEPLVKSVFAEGLKENSASYKILEKTGFIKAGETNDYYQWRLALK